MYCVCNTGMKKEKEFFSKQITRSDQMVIITENVEDNILNILLINWVIEYISPFILQ